MKKSRNITLEERIGLTMSPHLFKNIKTECHICRSGGKRNLETVTIRVGEYYKTTDKHK